MKEEEYYKMVISGKTELIDAIDVLSRYKIRNYEMGEDDLTLLIPLYLLLEVKFDLVLKKLEEINGVEFRCDYFSGRITPTNISSFLSRVIKHECSGNDTAFYFDPKIKKVFVNTRIVESYRLKSNVFSNDDNFTVKRYGGLVDNVYVKIETVDSLYSDFILNQAILSTLVTFMKLGLFRSNKKIEDIIYKKYSTFLQLPLTC